ncbi:MAG: penicillin-binding protein 2 [Candidatus Acetothermia bacterium]|jgi:cell division protein FtsI/penicillin-binding protein 2|nr:penicillin-binding protein 2 [Candidatus Acetothermia bacterium]MDH7504704.1 penicillin-binding protein 2 [Candidatus Acetothermia bacterium]
MTLRLKLALALLFLLLAATGGRLFQLQVLQHGFWVAQAQRIQERELVEPYPRGRIYDRNGLLLASDLQSYSFAIDPQHLEKAEALKSILKRNLGLSDSFLRDAFAQESYFVWIKRKVDPATAERVEKEAREAQVKGLIIIPEWRRVYPQGELASSLLGFAGLDNQGLEGLELGFDELLRGTPGRLRLLRSGDGEIIAERVREAGRPGADLVLTIDARVQHLAEEKISWGVAEYQAKNGFIAVMDPETGELLALAQARRYDPNDFAHSTPEERLNYAISWPFEPGSVMKVFVALAALEYGVITTDERVSGNEPVIVGGHRFRNAPNHSYGPVTLKDIISRSINTGMIRVSLRLEEEQLYDFLRRLGFGQEAGLGLPGEVGGSLRPVSQWSAPDRAAIAIGQAISVTGIQLLAAGAALANGGIFLKPQLIKEIRRSDGKVERLKPEIARQVAGSWSIAALKGMMVEVVESGTGMAARIKGFSIAAKSGTAQKALPGEGYVEGKYVSSFLGFFPAERPQFAILVVLDEVGVEPYWGGQTAGTVFRKLAERLIDLMNLTPER